MDVLNLVILNSTGTFLILFFSFFFFAFILKKKVEFYCGVWAHEKCRLEKVFRHLIIFKGSDLISTVCGAVAAFSPTTNHICIYCMYVSTITVTAGSLREAETTRKSRQKSTSFSVLTLVRRNLLKLLLSLLGHRVLYNQICSTLHWLLKNNQSCFF